MYNENETIKPVRQEQLQICLFALLDETLLNRELLSKKELDQFIHVINYKK